MTNFCRSVQSCALAACALGLSTPAAAQEAVPNSPPELRDFRLRPNAPPPAEPEPLIVPVLRPPAVAAPAPPPAATTIPPRAQPVPARQAQPAPARQPQAAPPVARAAPSPVTTAPPLDEPVAEVAPPPVEAEPLPPLAAEIAPPAAPAARPPVAADAPGLPGWTIWAALGLALSAIATALVVRRTRHREPEREPEVRDREQVALDRLLLAGTAQPSFPPDPAPAPAPAAPPAGRPWIEIEFRPGTASATAEQTVIEYELVLANKGEGEARNVRGSARIFSASKDQNAELAAFFAEAVEPSGPPRTIAPGETVGFSQALMLPAGEMKPVEMHGRSLLIPLIAFNVRYEWGDGQEGQTAMSFVVGREARPPAEKMAPLRLDLGPRVYRQLATRRHALKLVA